MNPPHCFQATSLFYTPRHLNADAPLPLWPPSPELNSSLCLFRGRFTYTTIDLNGHVREIQQRSSLLFFFFLFFSSFLYSSFAFVRFVLLRLFVRIAVRYLNVKRKMEIGRLFLQYCSVYLIMRLVACESIKIRLRRIVVKHTDGEGLCIRKGQGKFCTRLRHIFEPDFPSIMIE